MQNFQDVERILIPSLYYFYSHKLSIVESIHFMPLFSHLPNSHSQKQKRYSSNPPFPFRFHNIRIDISFCRKNILSNNLAETFFPFAFLLSSQANHPARKVEARGASRSHRIKGADNYPYETEMSSTCKMQSISTSRGINVQHDQNRTI